MTTRLEKVVKFLNETFGRIPQCFCTNNVVGDELSTIYTEDGVVIDYSDIWSYIEVFGLTKEEFQELVNIYDKQ